MCVVTSRHLLYYCKTRFFVCPLFREFREPDKFAKITGREDLNIAAFKLTQTPKLRVAKIKGFTVSATKVSLYYLHA